MNVVFFVLIIFLVSMASASFTKGDYLIEKSYAPESAIKGWVNISLTNEPANSVLKSSFGESISLIDLLEKNSNLVFDYVCNPLLCDSNYLANNEQTLKILNLNESETVLIGLNISRKNILTDVSGFSLNFTSNNPETEKLPLSIDILNDGQEEWVAYVASPNFGTENFGCFIGTPGMQKAEITQTPYCERITLKKTPEVEMGAYVEEVPGSGAVDFDISIQDVDTGQSRSCTTGISGSGRISCIPPDFSVNKDGDYFVCVGTLSSMDDRKYKIAYEQTSPCGFSGTYDNKYDYDFEIFAKPKKYAPNVNFTLDNNGLVEARSPVTNIEQYIENYISSVYNNDCSKDCIIPIKIFSGVNQQLNVSDLSLSYVAGISTTTNKLYNIEESPATITTSKFQKLYLNDAGFKAPAESGNHTLSVSLNNDEIFSEKIFVGEVALIKSLTPTKTAIKYPTKFRVVLNDSQNITKYTWNFGDGSSQNTSINSVIHTYNTVGNYKFTITLLDSKGTSSSKEFSINVGPASTIVPDLIDEAETNLAYVKNQVSNFSGFEKKALNYSLKLEETEKKIATLKNSISGASSEAQYEAVLGELLEINVPKAIAKTAYSEGISFYPQVNNIDMNIIKEIGGGSYEKNKENRYKEAVLAWEEANTNTIMVYNEISSIYEDYEQPFMKTFDISVTNNGGTAYLIIKNMKNLLFKEDYSKKEKNGYVYITLNSGKNNVVFSTTENVDFVNLPAFVSPPISELTLAEWTPFTPEGSLKKWILFSLIAIGIILVALAAWIFLQFWYKRKYENYLFKNRNNLYNLINYIGNEKQRGTNEKDMIEKLKKAGWNSEQIRYAVRKYEGKRTGMPEIPVEKILKRKEK